MRYFKKSKNTLIKLSMVTSLFLGASCSEDSDLIEINNEENQLSELSESFSSIEVANVTPVVNNIYTIVNKDNGRTLDIENKSNSNGANLQVWGTDANTTGTHRQWEVISVEGDYVRLKGVDSGKCLETTNGGNSNGVNVQQWAWQSTTHQQWEIISVGDGYFRLKNRDSGKCLTAEGAGNGSNVGQWAYDGLDTQKWFFTEVGQGSTTPPTNSSDFISTNDGSFDLNDFQIESSSHLTSTTSKTTTSWDVDESYLLATEWYTFSGGDYYLKSASYDGKRTEWKEASGKESSLNTSKTMTYEASITEIPENGVTIAQMHNRFKDSDSYKTRRPFLRVYIEDGKIHVKKTNNDLTNTSGSYDTATVGPSVSEGQKFKIQLITGSGKVNVKAETSSGTMDEDYYPNTGGSYDDYKNDFYFKAGVYTEGNDTEPIIRFYSFEN